MSDVDVEIESQSPDDAALAPRVFETRVLEKFKSTDDTRLSMCQVYTYKSDGGRTDVATNGHVILARRSGTHRTMSYTDIRKLGHQPAPSEPPPWDRVLVKSDPFGPKMPSMRGIDPNYFALIADVERAAGKRDAQDYVPKYGTSKKIEKIDRDGCSRKFMMLIIPADEFAAWFFTVDARSALWEGAIMPRRA